MSLLRAAVNRSSKGVMLEMIRDRFGVRVRFHLRLWRYWLPPYPPKSGSRYRRQFGPVIFNPIWRHTISGYRWALWIGCIEVARLQPCGC